MVDESINVMLESAIFVNKVLSLVNMSVFNIFATFSDIRETLKIIFIYSAVILDSLVEIQQFYHIIHGCTVSRTLHMFVICCVS